MPVSRQGGDELVLRRFSEVKAEAEAVAGRLPINGASASSKNRGDDCGFTSTFRGD